VHASWDEFYNYTDTIHDFIDGLIDTVGKEGTIVMPAYPLLRKKSSVFDISRTPTAAGLIAEEFRKYPGVLRSVNRHSACALGPNAAYLVNEHQFSTTSWDEKSPYFKLGEIHAKVFSFGLGSKFVGTIMHVADSMLRTKHPYFQQFFTKKLESEYRLIDKSTITTETLIAADDFELFFTYRGHSRVIKKNYAKEKYKRTRLSNLTINFYDANYFIKHTIDLASKGIVVYIKPDPKQFFRK
jgi:aminoglycoside N3'-acetyltransferase